MLLTVHLIFWLVGRNQGGVQQSRGGLWEGVLASSTCRARNMSGSTSGLNPMNKDHIYVRGVGLNVDRDFAHIQKPSVVIVFAGAEGTPVFGETRRIVQVDDCVKIAGRPSDLCLPFVGLGMIWKSGMGCFAWP